MSEKEMSKETKKVVEDTIHHWERMIKWAKNNPGEKKVDFVSMAVAIGESIGATSCPLCQKYGAKNCYCCPLGDSFGLCSISNSKNFYQKTIDSQTWKEFVENAESFLSQIKSLLSQRKPLDFSKPLVDIYGENLTFCGVKQMYVVKSKEGFEDFIDEFGYFHKGVLYAKQKPETVYIPIKVGDRFIAFGNEYILTHLLNGVAAHNLETGNAINTNIHVKNVHSLTLDEFKKVLGLAADSWEKVYATLKRR